MGGAVAASLAALDELFARTAGGSRLGLERTAALLAALGHPERRLRALHIAGTNGKGSVAATLQAVLRARGWHVATYTSPHLIDFTERLLVDGVPVAAERVGSWIASHMPAIVAAEATFFEATTAMAFDLFADEGVDLAVIETGLGGRLDSTNVLSPLVAGVTSIGIDHVEYLGGTREQIAREKAGIFKPGVPAVVGERDPSIAALLADYARHAGAEPVRVIASEWETSEVAVDARGTAFRLRIAGGAPARTLAVRTPLVGHHQASNCATALAMLDALPGEWRIPPDQAVAGLADVRLPGRFHRHGRWLFDVAHNRDGARVLADTIRAVRPPAPVAAVVCVLGDKDWRGMLDELAPVVDGLIVTQAPTAPASRAWDPAEAARYAESRAWPVSLEPDFVAALREAESAATALVTGSFHTVGDAMARLSVTPYGG